MRQFYESWNVVVNRQPTAGDLDWQEFFSLGFTQHMEILSKTTTLEERVYSTFIRKQLYIGANLDYFL